MSNILLTGFAPFGGESTNPSWEAVKQLDGARIKGHRVHAREMSVVFGVANKELRKWIRELKPALVICVGQAGGRATMSLERVAINVDDARIPDNDGQQPIDEVIVADGPDAYFTSLPIKAMLRDMKAAGIPVAISQTAGTFVCNHVFYGLMHTIRTRKKMRGGFIHIPFSPEQAAQHADAPSLAIDTIVHGLRIGITTCLKTDKDVAIVGGAEH